MIANPMIVGVTGASGMPYAVRTVQVLAELDYPIALVISDSAKLVIKEELGIQLRSWQNPDELEKIFGSCIRGKLTAYAAKDFTAPIASGSYPVQGMILIPCSMGTLGAVASGLSLNLIHRAADCVIKEGRKLVLVPRETPLSAIHLENMLKLARLGVSMVPAMPGFYSGVKTVADMVDFVTGKVLDQFQVPHGLYPRWTGPLVREQKTAGNADE